MGDSESCESGSELGPSGESCSGGYLGPPVVGRYGLIVL